MYEAIFYDNNRSHRILVKIYLYFLLAHFKKTKRIFFLIINDLYVIQSNNELRSTSGLLETNY